MYTVMGRGYYMALYRYTQVENCPVQPANSECLTVCIIVCLTRAYLSFCLYLCMCVCVCVLYLCDNTNNCNVKKQQQRHRESKREPHRSAGQIAALSMGLLISHWTRIILSADDGPQQQQKQQIPKCI